jgi:hypothetical protein
VASSQKPKDLVLVHGRTADGNGLNVLRARDQQVEVGTVRPLEEGRPLQGEVVKLTPRPEMPNLYDAETQYQPPKAANAAGVGKASDEPPQSEGRPTNNGPAQVASDAYRKNWDAIWKRPAKRRALPN